MAVGHNDRSERLISHLAAVRLSVPDKELLVTGKSIHGWRFLTAVGCTIAIVGCVQAAEISYVLIEDLASLEMKARESLVRVVLVGKHLGRRLKVREVRRRPPVVKLALSV